MHPFESLTPAQVQALSLAERALYEAWFWDWMQGDLTNDLIHDIATERREGWGYDTR